MRPFVGSIPTLALVAVLACGCATVERVQRSAQELMQPQTRPMTSAPAKTTAAKRADQITLGELGQLTYAYADRYLTYMVSACDAIERDNPDPAQRRLAHQVKLVQVGAVYDIATNPDPFTQLLDLVLVVTLQSQKWIDEDLAERRFGDRARPLIVASRRAREDIWQVAARVLTPEQLELLDYLIWEWRNRNRDVEMVSYVRFDEFAASRGKSIVADVKSGGGLLAPVDDALKAVDDARLLAERAFFYSKRVGILLNWQVRGAVDDVLEGPHVRGLSTSISNAAGTFERLPALVAAERRATFDDLERRQPLFASLTGHYRGIAGDTTTMATALTGLTDSSQRLITLMDGYTRQRSDSGHPFDIRDYGATLEKLAVALQEANRLAAHTSGLVTQVSPERIDALAKGGSGHAGAMAERVLDAAFWRGAALILVFFVLLVAYKVLSLKLERGRAGRP